MFTLNRTQKIATLAGEEVDCLLAEITGRLPFRAEYFNGKKTGRDECWLGKMIVFNSDTDIAIVNAPPTRFVPVLDGLRAAYYPSADSVLVYRYPEGRAIGEHRDKGCERRVVMVNLFDSPRDLFGDKSERVRFRWGGNDYSLADGEVWEFDAGIRHSVSPAPCPRYSITFRKTREG